MTPHSVYWIHHPDHSDMFSQGYIGVSVNAERRWTEHLKKSGNRHLKFAIQKYGWDVLVKKQILVSDKKYCLDVEKKLRPTDGLGWNLVAGGGCPPIRYGNKDRLGSVSWSKGKNLSDEHRTNLSIAHMGQKAWNKGLTGVQTAWNKGLKATENQRLAFAKNVQCDKCGKIGLIGLMTRWHFENCGKVAPYRARVTVEGKRILIGRFKTKEEAKACQDNYYKEHNIVYTVCKKTNTRKGT
jgi:predicted GIY-YIG superfamily endonuclease